MQVRDAQAVKGRAQSAIWAACIFQACKMRGAPRTFKEIGAAAPEAKSKDIGRCFTAIDK
jgi:transcription initiation factor TFIIB